MKPLIFAGITTLWMAGAEGQTLLRVEMAEAIEAGRAGKTLQKRCSARGDNGFDFTVEGPVGRIMRAAREAKRQNREFTVDDVTVAMSSDVVTVTARRDRTLTNRAPEDLVPGSSDRYKTDFVIRSKPPGSQEPIVLKPLGPIIYDIENVPGNPDVRNSRGRVTGSTMTRPFPGSDMTAAFDLFVFKAIPHRDVEVVVFMTDTGEHRCGINEKERQAIR
jgi:hypothetical protein